MLSPDYINSLTFDYAETYSVQRRKELKKLEKELLTEQDRLLDTKRDNHSLLSDLYIEKRKQFNELSKLFDSGHCLVKSNGQLHPSSIKTNTFKSEDAEMQLLRSILQTEVIKLSDWLCAPIYRDAVVFYDNYGKIISILNICLGCEYMNIEGGANITADEKTYTLLRNFFIDIGHEVED